MGNQKQTEERGKGYGEGEILAYAIKNSELIKKCSYIIKITGRLKVKNINLIINLLSNSKNYFNSYIDNNNNFFIDTRFFAVKIKSYKRYFMNAYIDVNDNKGIFLEYCIAQKIEENNIPYNNFPLLVNIEGQSGSTGMSYFTSKKEEILKSIDIFLRYLLNRQKKNSSIKILQRELVWDESIWNMYYKELQNKKIIIYGAGIIGHRFYKLCRKHCEVVAWIDKNYEKIRSLNGKKIISPIMLDNYIYDYIVVALKNIEEFKCVKRDIVNKGIDDNIIISGDPYTNLQLLD